MDWNSDKPLNGVRALLATDKPFTKELLTSALRSAGAGQVKAGSGPDMLQAVLEFKPDVIFAEFDLMPFDGNDFIGHLRSDFKLTTPAILLFHDGDQKKVMAGAVKAGINGALPIPFTRDSVVKMTQKVLRAKV